MITFQIIQAAYTTQYQKNKQPNQKVGKRPKQTFLQEDKQVANTWSILLIIREMQIKTKMRYHFTPVRMASIKNSQIINAGEGVTEGNPPTLLVGI